MTRPRQERAPRCPDCGDPLTRPGLLRRCADRRDGGKRQ